MRFMVIVKATRDSEAGLMPSTEMLAAMGKFNAELVEAGMMEAGEGLHPSAKGARLDYAGGTASVTRGPFPARPISLPASGCSRRHRSMR